MKEISRIIKAVAVTLAAAVLAACTEGQDSYKIGTKGQMSITASQETPAGTKTSVQPDRSVIWDIEEEIMVFGNGTSAKFTSDNAEPSASAEFYGSDAVSSEGGELWAVYPYDETASFDGSSITTVVSNEQTAKAGTFARNTNLSIAKSESSLLQFYNVGGGVRFTVTEEGITKVIFEGLEGEAIAGTVKVGFGEDGKPEVKEVTDGRMFITLNAPEGKSLIPGEWYYIVAIPGTLEKGFKMRFYKGETYGRRISDKEVTLKRSVYGTLEKADSELEYPVVLDGFPETDEQSRAALKIVEDIAPATEYVIGLFEDVGDRAHLDASKVAPEVEKIEGVRKAKVTESGNISILTDGGIWANLIVTPLNDNLDLFQSKVNSPEMPDTGLTSKLSSTPAPKPASTIIGGGKKAILLNYVIDEDRTAFVGFNSFYIDDLYNQRQRCLEDAGFIVDRYDGPEATLDRFRGDNLDDYDFVQITTHGLYDLTTFYGKTTSGFQTATKSDYNGPIPLPSAAICIGRGQTTLWMTALAMEDDNPQFNNTWFYANTCYSYVKDDMASVVLSHGAAAYTGNTNMSHKYGGSLVSSYFINLMAQGYEFDDAARLAKNRVRSQCGYNPSYDMGILKNRRRTGDLFYLVDPGTGLHPEIEVSVENINFGNVKPGQEVEQTFTIRNTGNLPLSIHEISFHGGKPFKYSIYLKNGPFANTEDGDKPAFTINKGESQAVTVSFKPTSEGSFSDKITIISNATNSEETSIWIKGNGASSIRYSDVSFSSTYFSFGSSFIGKSLAQDLVIKNNSKSNLVISGVDIPAGFKCNGSFPMTLSSGQSYTFRIEFRPENVGRIDGYFRFHMNTDRGYTDIWAVGTGVSKGSVGYAVDLGLPSGVKWASWNVGASSPKDAGASFRWGDTNALGSGYPESYSGNPSVLPLSNDAARANWGGSWRMPTKDEIDELAKYCQFTYNYEESEPLGSNWFTGTYFKVTGPNGNSIYLPAVSTDGKVACSVQYWSSSLMQNELAYGLQLIYNYIEDRIVQSDTQYFSRGSLCLIRPVMK